ASLAQHDIYVTYLFKCRPLCRFNKEAVGTFSKPFLTRQIKMMSPKFIVCLGDTVTQVLFDDKEAHVKELRGAWHAILGIPCAVSYHPLAVRRRPNLMRHFLEDWNMLAQRLHGKHL
ncbi:MAG: uracil-DNA glycosylase, partial [Syntrophomonadaceae bacterium]|nr:uracil-DNA glycosylase [Syntrophomonadaceae bacterium]